MPIVNNQFNIILMTSVYLLRRICTFCSHRLRRHHFVLPWHACLPLGYYLSLSIRHGSSFTILPLFRSILVRLCQQYHYQCQPYYCITPSLHRTSVRTVASFSHGVTQGWLPTICENSQVKEAIMRIENNSTVRSHTSSVRSASSGKLNNNVYSKLIISHSEYHKGSPQLSLVC